MKQREKGEFTKAQSYTVKLISLKDAAVNPDIVALSVDKYTFMDDLLKKARAVAEDARVHRELILSAAAVQSDDEEDEASMADKPEPWSKGLISELNKLADLIDKTMATIEDEYAQFIVTNPRDENDDDSQSGAIANPKPAPKQIKWIDCLWCFNRDTDPLAAINHLAKHLEEIPSRAEKILQTPALLDKWRTFVGETHAPMLKLAFDCANDNHVELTHRHRGRKRKYNEMEAESLHYVDDGLGSMKLTRMKKPYTLKILDHEITPDIMAQTTRMIYENEKFGAVELLTKLTGISQELAVIDPSLGEWLKWSEVYKSKAPLPDAPHLRKDATIVAIRIITQSVKNLTAILLNWHRQCRSTEASGAESSSSSSSDSSSLSKLTDASVKPTIVHPRLGLFEIQLINRAIELMHKALEGNGTTLLSQITLLVKGNPIVAKELVRWPQYHSYLEQSERSAQDKVVQKSYDNLHESWAARYRRGNGGGHGGGGGGGGGRRGRGGDKYHGNKNQGRRDDRYPQPQPQIVYACPPPYPQGPPQQQSQPVPNHGGKNKGNKPTAQ